MSEAQRQFKFPLGGSTLVLKYGRFFSPCKKPKAIGRGERGLCFMNAANLVLHDPTLTYVEGFAHCGLLPVEHAWAVDEQCNVIDNTWKKIGHAYYGVPLTIEALKLSLVENGYYGVFGGMGRLPYIFTLKEKALQSAIKKLNHDSHPQTQKERRIRGRIPAPDRR